MEARKSNDKSVLVPDARDALERMKYETAEELDINLPDKDDWGDVTSRDCGRVGGNMVRKMIEIDENQMKKE
jgi:hypothetical protein